MILYFVMIIFGAYLLFFAGKSYNSNDAKSKGLSILVANFGLLMIFIAFILNNLTK